MIILNLDITNRQKGATIDVTDQARDGPFRAVVLGTYNRGSRNQYTVADPRGHDETWPPGRGTVTFGPKEWTDRGDPPEGSFVIIERPFKTPKGWRAQRARLFRPSDEEDEAT